MILRHRKGRDMAEQFLTLMAELDAKSQSILSGMYNELYMAGFRGSQTPGLSYHISLANLPLEKEGETVERMYLAASEFAPVKVHISHMGIFAGGKVLFGAPEMNAGLSSLRDAVDIGVAQSTPFTPHVSILIDEPETICDAVKVLVKCFKPFMATIDALHLCAFWPTREIARVFLKGER